MIRASKYNTDTLRERLLARNLDYADIEILLEEQEKYLNEQSEYVSQDLLCTEEDKEEEATGMMGARTPSEVMNGITW